MKKIMLAVAVTAALCALYFTGTGFIKNTSVYISDFSVSENGREITVEAQVSSSAEFIRSAHISRQENGVACVEFYSAFGGLNGKVGAKNTFILPIDDGTSAVEIYKGKNKSETVLVKSSSGVWQFAANVAE